MSRPSPTVRDLRPHRELADPLLAGDAPRAGAGAEVDIRPLRPGQYGACVELQRATWGAHYGDIVPASLLKIAQRIGGIALGAFRGDGALEGFVFGITGAEGGRLIHWSHMLAVRPGLRGGGIGRRLKEAQRDALRAQGVARVYWTFDPLVARNAHLNLMRLGVEVVEYVPDMYGASDSALHRGIGTDRFVVVWHIDAGARDPRSRPAMMADVTDTPVANLDCGGADEHTGTVRPPVAPIVRVAVLSNIERVQAESPATAAAWRRCTRLALQHYLGQGDQVAGFDGEDRTGRCYYVLSAPAAPLDDAATSA